MPLIGRLLRQHRALFAVTALALLLLPSLAQAQGQGGIQGVVRNGETGAPLDYANVVLTRDLDNVVWGAMSLGGGRFFLNGLPSGTYTLKVLYLGFKPVERKVNLSPGETLNLTFDLEVTVVKQFEVFDVEAAAIMVEVKDTEFSQTIGSDDLTDYAVDTVEEAVARQAGVVSRGGEIYVRGGRSGEVSFRVDGVAVDDPLGGNALSVSTFAVSNVATVTGGQDPEYGNALSGVVNITTREGNPEKFEMQARFMTDDFGRGDRTFTNYDRLEFGLGGPTGLDRFTYFISGDFRFSDQENYNRAERPETKVELFGAELFKYRRRQFNDVKGSLKLAYAFDEQSNMKLTGEVITNYTRWETYLPNWDVQGYVRQIVRMPVLGSGADGGLEFSGRYATFYYGPWVDRISSLAQTQMVSFRSSIGVQRKPMPVMQMRDNRGNLQTAIAQPVFVGARHPDGVYSTVPRDTSMVAINSANQGPQNDRFTSQYKFVWRHNLTDDTFYTLKLARVDFYTTSTASDNTPVQFLHGGIDSPAPFGGSTRQYSTTSDYYSDPDNPLFVTDGSDWPLYNDQTSKQYSMNLEITSNRYEGHKLKSGLRMVYNDLEQELLFQPGNVTIDRYTGEVLQGTARNLFHTYNPEASFYLQDRWEYEGMVLNGGFRWDMFSPGSEAVIEVDSEELDRNVFKYKHQFSPRLGFAFPITDRDAFHFHYGRFVQFPGRDVLFASQSATGNLGTLGNPNLDAETTIQYQAGIKHQFSDYLAGQFAVYNRDIYGLISATQVTDEATGNTLARYINRAYGNARGLEFTLERRFHNRWSFEIAYTYAFADGVASSQEFGANPNGLEFLPNQELPLDWDQRHGLAMDLRIAEPNAWAASLSFDYGSGFPWTPNFRFERRQDPLLENSERLPQEYTLRIQMERHVNLYGQKLILYMQGLNLLNEDQVVSISPNINPGPIEATVAGVSYLTETGKFGSAYLQDIDGDNNDDFVPINDPRVFGQHRLFRFGVGWTF